MNGEKTTGREGVFSQEDGECSSNQGMSSKLRAIFSDSFVDQLEEECHCDMDKALRQSYQVLQSDKEIALLRDDIDIEHLKTLLGLHDYESGGIHEGNNHEKVYRLATLFLEKEMNQVLNLQLNPSELHGVPTVVKTVKTMSDVTRESHGRRSDATSIQEQAHEQAFSDIDYENLQTCPPVHTSFEETEVYAEILGTVKCKMNRVIHVYGMSGSGKSQIAITVCNRLAETRRVIWHVQCVAGLTKVRDKWKDLIVALENAGLITVMDSTNMKRCIESCDHDMKYFVNILQRLKVPVFLAVEDVTKEEKPLVENFVRQIVAAAKDRPSNVQLMIVDQKKDSLISQSDMHAMDDYAMKHVEGFTEQEAVNFLTEPNLNSEGITELAEALAYSPLRLSLAKAYCLKYKESYASYYESLGTDADIIAKEIQYLSEHPSVGRNHGYEVVIRNVRPKDPHNLEENNSFFVCKMMSFLNNNNISDLLLGRFFQVIVDNHPHEGEHQMTVVEERKQVLYLVEKLESDLNCMVRCLHEATEQTYGNRLISIHVDILHAIRMHMSDEEKSRVMTMVLQALISFVGKENRLRTDSRLLFDMMGHMYSVAGYANNLLEAQFSLQKPEKEHFEIQMGLCRLYDVLGFATTQHAPISKDANFEIAIDFCWSIACSYTGNKFFRFCNKIDKSKLEQMFHYQVDKSPLKTAEDACNRLKKASNKIPGEYIVKISERLFPVTLNLLKDMKEKLGKNCKINWEEMEKTLRISRCLSKKHIEILQNHEMLLKQKALQDVFLPQYLASILHSRGRQVLYLKDTISVEEQRRYEWYTDVGLHLCRISSQGTGKKSIFEYILLANNKLPRMLHTRNDETDDGFWIRIRDAREMAKQLRDDRSDFYEHGVYKLVSGTPYTVMNAMKYLVKSNTKLYKRPLVAQQHPIAEAALECETLFKLSKENASKFVVASSCMVHVGKYYAAAQEYDKALEAFEFAFDYDGHGINSQLEKNPNIYAWALYNTGRAIYAGRDIIRNVVSHNERFMKRCHLLIMPGRGGLKEALDGVKYKLEHITFLSKEVSSCSR